MATHDNGTEVIGLIRTNTSSGKPTISPTKTPELERHISKIPQTDNDVDDEDIPNPTKPSLIKKLKSKLSRKPEDEANNNPPLSSSSTPPPLHRQISKIPPNDYDSDTESPQPQKVEAAESDRHDSGHAEFEVSPLLHLSSDETAQKKGSPKLDRQISLLPEKDETTLGPGSRLERTISWIPRDDYDSEEER